MPNLVLDIGATKGNKAWTAVAKCSGLHICRISQWSPVLSFYFSQINFCLVPPLCLYHPLEYSSSLSNSKFYLSFKALSVSSPTKPSAKPIPIHPSSFSEFFWDSFLNTWSNLVQVPQNLCLIDLSWHHFCL